VENPALEKSPVLRNKQPTKKAKVRCIPAFYQSLDCNFEDRMTHKNHSFLLMVVGLSFLEGRVIYLNMVVHPDNQPALTVVIVILFAIVSGLSVWYRTRVLGMTYS
jgi:hypothetical protein